MRLLLLEDDDELRSDLKMGFESSGFAVDGAATLADARGLVDDGPYDVAVLDRLLPDGDSLSLLREHADAGTPLNALVLSAYADPNDRIAGLEAGALDYLAKPVRFRELVLRVQILAQAQQTPTIVEPVVVGSVSLDVAKRSVAIEGREVHLTPTQYGVFEYLMLNLDRLVETEELLDHCWDRNRDLFSNPLHTQITRLRGVFAGHLHIESHRGQGYRIVQADGGGQV